MVHLHALVGSSVPLERPCELFQCAITSAVSGFLSGIARTGTQKLIVFRSIFAGLFVGLSAGLIAVLSVVVMT